MIRGFTTTRPNRGRGGRLSGSAGFGLSAVCHPSLAVARPQFSERPGSRRRRGLGACAMSPLRVLVQTSISFAPDDWHVGRFSALVETLRRLKDSRGRSMVEVVARDRSPDETGHDPVLVHLDRAEFDELWLLAVDGGRGSTILECAAVDGFQRAGGGVLTARDHQDMGLWLRRLRGVGSAHFFHDETCRELDHSRWCRDDRGTLSIDFPNYHSGSNGDFQELVAIDPLHPLVMREGEGSIGLLPAHPHEGAVAPPVGDARARTVAQGRSQVTRLPFNLAVAFDRGGEFLGRGVAESSFHHFADYNWDPSAGAPSFVVEPTGTGMRDEPRALADTKAYVRNLVLWLAPAPLLH